MTGRVVAGEGQFDLALKMREAYRKTDGAGFRTRLRKEGLSTRKGYYLLTIVENMKRLKYSQPEGRRLIRELGWTKTAILLRRKKKLSVTSLIQRYKHMTVAEIRSVLSPQKAQMRTFACSIPQDVYDMLMEHLEAYGKKPRAGSKHPGLGEAFGKFVRRSVTKPT